MIVVQSQTVPKDPALPRIISGLFISIWLGTWSVVLFILGIRTALMFDLFIPLEIFTASEPYRSGDRIGGGRMQQDTRLLVHEGRWTHLPLPRYPKPHSQASRYAHGIL
jgi:hypothetical protein